MLTIVQRLYNNSVMNEINAQFAALADPTRRAILARLAQGEATVAELQRPLGISQPAVSRHPRLLQEEGVGGQSRAAQARPRRLRPEGLDAARAWIEGLRDLWSDTFDRLETFLADPEQGNSR